MSSSYSLTDFSHSTYAYTTDGGVSSKVSMRNVYATPSGLTVTTSALPVFPSKHARRRYIHSPSGGNSAPGHSLTRHYPVAITQVASPTSPGTIDGVTDWALMGYRGEQDRG